MAVIIRSRLNCLLDKQFFRILVLQNWPRLGYCYRNIRRHPMPRTLREFALSRLRVCFPEAYPHMVAELSQRELAKNAPAPTPQPVESKPAVNGRCSVRGCVWPSAVGTLCRSHVADSLADRSLMPALTGMAITNLNRLIA
jgi:hypothetical protein